MKCFQTLEESESIKVLSAQGPLLIFKHSNRCSISSTALNRLDSFCSEIAQSLPSYIVDVVAQRDFSQSIAKQLNVIHESPQVILLNKGEVVYHTSHLNINKKDLISEVNKFNLLN